MENPILKNVDVARAWKDEVYRASLSDKQRAALPQNPAELDALSDEQLEDIAGGVSGTGTDTGGCTGTGGGGTVSCTMTR
jgi:mersacidin/lichenicidin family type 2 lantibiotic